MSVSLFQLQNELSPILLQNGIAEFLPGGVMPIILLTEPEGIIGLTANEFFAHFKNLPNGTLSEWQIAEYPFASLVMAANAVIQMPLKISMMMTCPAQTDFVHSYFAKLPIITSLQTQIQTHVSLGGTFIVNTPAMVYTDLLLRSIRDVTSPNDKQVQSQFVWEFEQPLITQAGATQILGNFNNKIESGLPTPISWGTQLSTPNPVSQ